MPRSLGIGLERDSGQIDVEDSDNFQPFPKSAFGY
jgi:hypothetical protein